MHRLLACLFLIAACATSPDEQRHTIYVGFDRIPTDSDIGELETLGASLQYRLVLARAVTLRTSLPPEAFEAKSGVVATHDLGEEEDPTVSVFMRTGTTPTEKDAQDVRDAGATRVHIIESPFDIITAVIRLSRVPGLEELDQFISIEVDLGVSRIQPGS